MADNGKKSLTSLEFPLEFPSVHSLTGAVEAAGPDALVVVVGRHDAVQDLLLLLAVVDLLLFATRPVNVVVVAPESIALH